MKKILGLDLGTNSIGWALIEKDEEYNNGRIINIGSRIIPMGDDKGNFEAGKKITRNAVRRAARSSRRGNHRYKLRRNKLVFALNKLGMLPDLIGFGYYKESENNIVEKIMGVFPIAEKLQKVFIEPIKKGQKKNADPLDLLELRKKALTEKIELKQLGRILYLLNQRRGYNGGGDELEVETTNAEGETEKEKKIYKGIGVISITPIQDSEVFGKGKAERKYPCYNIKLKNKETNLSYEGRGITKFEIGEEVEVTILKSDAESKAIYFLFNNDAEKNDNTYKETFISIIEDCKPRQVYYKKKWAYEIDIVDEDDNEEEKIESGKLYLRNTKQVEQIKIGEKNEFEINIKTKGDNKEFEFFIPNQTNWKKNLDAIEKEIVKNQKANKELGIIDATGKGNYHICHYFIDKYINKVNDGKDLRIKDNVILRKRYEAEFDAIWERQLQCNSEFKALAENKELLEEIINYIFPGEQNTDNKNSLKGKFKTEAREKGLYYVIKKQIIYYQRDLKLQDDLIGTCQFEIGDKNKGINPEKVIERSHPLFQEFRMWDKINNIYVEQRNPEGEKYKYKKRFLTNHEKAKLYDALNNCKELSYNGLEDCLDLQKNKEFKKAGKSEFNSLNPEQRFKYLDIVKGLHRKEKIKGNETKEIIKKLWGKELFEKLFIHDFTHYEEETAYATFYKILYDSVNCNELDIDDRRVQDIRNFYKQHIKPEGLDTEIDYENLLDKKALSTAAFKFPRKYASLSKKAIENLLGFMQPLHDGESYGEQHMERLEKLAQLNEQYYKDFNCYNDKEEKENKISKSLIRDFFPEYAMVLYKGGLPYFAASGLYYGRHTAQQVDRINNYHDIQPLSKEETLRNPVVEQIVNETLQTIKSILKEYNLKHEELEIRVELARELKNNAEERAGMHDAMLKNALANKYAAYELMQVEYDEGKKKKTPENLCKKDGCTQNCYKSAKLTHPTTNQVLKYKLWKEQGFISPYTGQTIPFCDLFNGAEYNKEHIIPKQRFFDDSNANLVMAEVSVNKVKDNLTAVEFIKQYGGKEINGFRIRTLSEYDIAIRNTFKGRKQKNLLMDKIPEDFVERQKKETQYIARKVKEKLGSIVGLENITTTTGGITDHLRELWGLNQIFKEMNIERFERMAVMADEPKDKWVFEKEDESRKGGKKKNLVIKNWSKRLDHRHHAIDALTIACTTQGQITQLNNLNQLVQQEFKKYYQLTNNDGEKLTDEQWSEKFAALRKEERDKLLANLDTRYFEKPWQNFTSEAKEKIEQTIVSFKQKKRILVQNKEDKKTGNRLDDLMLKVRGALHLATVYGTKNIERFKNIGLEEAFNNPSIIVNEIIKNGIISRKEIYGEFKIFKSKLKDNPIAYFEGDKEMQIKDGKATINVKAGFGDVNTKSITLESIGKVDNPMSLIEKIVFRPLRDEIEKHFKIDNNSNKTEAFSPEGIDELNDKRSKKGLKPLYKVVIYFAKNTDDISLKPIKHKFSFKRNKEDGEVYYETKDNYCYAILEKNNQKEFEPITFFDAVQWVTEQFRNDIKTGFQFPKHYELRLQYVETIIKNKITELNPGYEISSLLQQDDLVYHKHTELDEKDFKIPTNVKDDGYRKFWFEDSYSFKQFVRNKEGEEIEVEKTIRRFQRIYRVVKFTGNRSYYVHHNIASPINYKPVLEEEEKIQREKDGKEIPKDGIFEFSDKNCSQFEITEDYIIQALKKKDKKYKAIKIQDSCIKIEVDRLGNIKPLL